MTGPPPEFSRRLALGSVGPEGKRLSLAATPAECLALAGRFAIPAVESLEAELTLKPEADGGLRVLGRLRARVVQSCVVTLEPVAEAVEEAVELRLLPDGTEPIDDDPEAPDELVAEGGAVDLGEALAEQLALALDPYPRAPGAELPKELGEGTPAGPFAALQKLRRDQA